MYQPDIDRMNRLLNPASPLPCRKARALPLEAFPSFCAAIAFAGALLALVGILAAGGVS